MVRTATSYTKAKVDQLIASLNAGTGITRAQMEEAIAAVVNSSPAALDTLGELAAALGNDPNLVNVINAALADRVKGTVRLTASDTVPLAPALHDLWVDTKVVFTMKEIFMADSPLALWMMNETASPAADSTTNGLSLSAFGSPSFGQSGPKTEKAVYLNGNSSLKSSINPGFAGGITNGPADCTISGWFKTIDPGSYNMNLAWWGSVTTYRNRGMFTESMQNPPHDIWAFRWTEIGAKSDPKSIHDGNWHHVAVRFTGTTAQTFVDGVLAGTGSPFGVVDEPADRFSLGMNYPASSMGFVGWIGPVAIYTRALTDAQIKKHYDAGV